MPLLRNNLMAAHFLQTLSVHTGTRARCSFSREGLPPLTFPGKLAKASAIFLQQQLPDKRIKAGGLQKRLKNNLKRSMLMLV